MQGGRLFVEEQAMPFEELANARMRSDDNVGVSIAHYITSGNANHSSSVVIKLAPHVLMRMGWVMGARVRVLEGTGVDSGYLAVELCPTGYKMSEEKAGVVIKFVSRTLRHYAVPPEGRGLTNCDYQAFGGRLTIEVPTWLTYKETTDAR